MEDSVTLCAAVYMSCFACVYVLLYNCIVCHMDVTLPKEVNGYRENASVHTEFIQTCITYMTDT